jgi:cytochrome c553
MTSKKMYFITAIIAAAFVFESCKKDDPAVYDCSGVTSTYTTDVKPIIDNNCATAGCHNATSQANGIDLSNYNSVKSNAASSNFMGSMEHKSGFNAMPQGAAKLSDANLKTIACWIENGMLQ